MGSTSYKGRARINPSAPEAVGVCDRCGALYNLLDLRFQFDWAGTAMINRQLRVCPTCYDTPQQQLRAIVLPPDPPPVWQPRPEPYLVDEANDYTLRAPIGKPFMFMAAGDMIAALQRDVMPSVPIDAVSDMAAALHADVVLSASLDALSDMTCDLDLVTPANFLVTEGNDFIITEGSDFLVTET